MIETEKRAIRSVHLRRWADTIARAAIAGAFGKSFVIDEIHSIPGPRAGALEIDGALNSGPMLKTLQQSEHALTRQLIPREFDFTGNPSAYMRGRYVRIEAGWPEAIARDDIPLSEILSNHRIKPYQNGRWLAGINETAQAIAPMLSDRSPHWLISGASGSGKSYALRSMVYQMCNPNTAGGGVDLVLCDGKYGEGLHGLDNLPGVQGPIAYEYESVRAALAWVIAQMIGRYRYLDSLEEAEKEKARADLRPLATVVDEVQDLVKDDAIAEMIRKIAAQGRGARVHLILATQLPNSEAFRDASTKRNLSGRLALRALDVEASRAAIGQTNPRADRLLGAGDGYIVVPGKVERIQCCYIPPHALDNVPRYERPRDVWPVFDASVIDSRMPEPNRAQPFDETEQALSLIHASKGSGRPALLNALVEAGLSRPGAERGIRLLKWGRAVYRLIKAEGLTLAETDCLTGEDTPSIVSEIEETQANGAVSKGRQSDSWGKMT